MREGLLICISENNEKEVVIDCLQRKEYIERTDL